MVAVICKGIVFLLLLAYLNYSYHSPLPSKETPKLEIYDTPVTSTDIEEALLYLSKIGAIALQGGFLVSYNGMEIKRLVMDNKIRYKNEDYRLYNIFRLVHNRIVLIYGQSDNCFSPLLSL